MESNAALAERLMTVFGKDMDFWWANADEALTLEFPFAPSIGMPERVSGMAESRAYLETVVTQLAGLTFRDLVVTPTADPDMVMLEYKGSCPAPNGQYNQKYITVMRFRNGKLSLFREYWDTAEVTRAFGNLGEAF